MPDAVLKELLEGSEGPGARREPASGRTDVVGSAADPAFERLARMARGLTASAVAMVVLHGPEGERVRCRVGELVLAGDAPAVAHVPLQVAGQRSPLVQSPLIIDDALADHRVSSSPAVVEGGVRAYLGIPLATPDGRVHGMFCVLDGVARRCSQQDIEIMIDLAASVLSEIELHAIQGYRDLARLVSQEATQRAQVEWFFTLAGALTGAVTIDDVVDAVTNLSADVAGAAFANVALLDPASGEVELRHGPGLSSDIGHRWPRVTFDDHTPLGFTIRTSQPVLLADIAQIRARFPAGADDAERAGFGALATVPIPRSRAALGYAWAGAVTFDDELLRVMRVTADLVGDALERAALYERERSVADLLQRSMLPGRLPRLHGGDVDALYAPGTAGLHVGGDWYDVAVLDDGRAMIAVGDVVGHGIEAAAAMGRLRTAFAAWAQHVSGVEQLAERLDQFAYDVDGARFSSAALVHYDTTSGTIEVVLAGHPPPLIRRVTGQVVQLPDAGPPLGLERHLPREVHRSVLAPGDAMLLFTDGLVEVRSASIDSGLARLRRSLTDAPVDGGAFEFCSAVYERMGRPQDDDVALLALCRQA